VEQVNLYLICKYFHIVFMTTWMAALFYLPRLFVYHSNSKTGTNEYKTFIVMEEKLIRYIMNPSLIFTWIFGVSLVVVQEEYHSLWVSLKFLCVLLMSIFHIYCVRINKNFKNRTNNKNSRYFRTINEVPTILFLVIVFLVVFKPFD